MMEKIKPMLAKSYTRLPEGGWSVQPKIDGIRCLYNGAVLYSRELNTFPGKQYIKEHLKPSNFILDGELYAHNTPLQDLNHYARTTDETLRLKYYVFDCYDPDHKEMPFSERWEKLKLVFKPSRYTELVPTRSIHKSSDVELYLNQFLEDQWEGIIIRRNNAIYEPGKRSSGLLKYKKFQTEEFAILEVHSGVGKFSGVPVFTLSSYLKNKKVPWKEEDLKDHPKNHTFKAVYAQDLETARQLYKDLVADHQKLFKEKYRLRPAVVQFYTYTKDKKPRFPIIKSLLI